MKPLLEKTWETIYIGANIMCNEDKQIKFNAESKEKYMKTFEVLYEQICNDYMEDNKMPLDRHKIAAIIIVSILKAEVLGTVELNEEKVFTGNYVLATEVSFSYMLGELNAKLKEENQKEIEDFVFPQAMSCKTDYFKIFYRNLFFANSNSEWGLNPLDIAERLFLVEYITLIEKKIDPNILKEY